MSEEPAANAESVGSANPNPSARLVTRIFGAVAGIVALEALAVLSFAVWLLVDIVAGQSRSLPTAISLNVLVAGLGAWLVLVARRLLQQERWARSAAIFWQTCMLAVASASFTGRGANAVIGVALIVPAVLVLVALFSAPVLRAAKAALERD